MTNTIDRWCAEQVGVENALTHDLYNFMLNGCLFQYQWTIQDPRCRQVVREHLGIDTVTNIGVRPTWYCRSMEDQMETYDYETIEEAEIAAITKLFEEHKDG